MRSRAEPGEPHADAHLAAGARRCGAGRGFALSQEPQQQGRVLVLGYGNPARGDDALAHHALEGLTLEGAEVVTCFQLFPEHAERLASASRVIFVDARVGPVSGEIHEEPLSTDRVPRQPLSHHLTPEHLLAMAKALYGAAPQATLVSVTVAAVEHGAALSEAVQAAIPELKARIAALVARGFRADPTTSTGSPGG